MELTVYWTQFAEEKLEDIYNYYKAHASQRVAEKLVDGLVGKSLDVSINPEGGQLEELLADRAQQYRYVVYKNYKIIYWVDWRNHKIFISHVFDSRQNPEKIVFAR